MAQTIKHKRSSITSTTPLTTQLVLGELAINTFDGDVFLKKDNGTESIIKLADDADLSAHTTSTSNPHSVTYTQVGAEPANANIQSHIASTSNPHSVTYTQVGAEPANANIQSHIGATNPHSGSAASGANTDITSVLLNQTGLVVKGATANALTIKPNETLTAGRTLNIITGDADRTLTLTGDASISGTHSGTSSGSNSGDQTITLTGGVTGSGTGSFAATVVTNANLTGPITSVGNATTITNSSVTLAHQADIATASFMGRNTAATGVQEVLSIATAKTMLGLTGVNSGDQTITLTGDVTGSGTGSFATTYNNAVPTTKGGTGNGFTKFSGPTTSEKTFTLPDATSTILTDNAAVTVAQGGTGNATLTAYSVLCGGTTSTAPIQSVASIGTSGQVLTSNGAGALPTFQAAAGGNIIKQSYNVTSHGFVTGDVIYRTSSAWAKAKADAASTIGTHMVELIDTNNFYAVQSGRLTGLSGLTAGSWYYVSAATAGAITTTEPAVGNYSNPIGFAETTSIFWVTELRASLISTPVVSKIVQVVNTQTGAAATTTVVIPYDDTIPQNTEGAQFMSLAITPTNTNNKLKIEVTFYGAQSGSAGTYPAAVVALFQDSTAGALAASTIPNVAATRVGSSTFTYYMTAGTTSATTFKVRAGPPVDTSSTLTFNGRTSARILGGVIASSITITEIQA